jgi:hypothetical protein
MDLPPLDTARLRIMRLRPIDGARLRDITNDHAITDAIQFLEIPFTLSDASH